MSDSNYFLYLESPPFLSSRDVSAKPYGLNGIKIGPAQSLTKFVRAKDLNRNNKHPFSQVETILRVENSFKKNVLNRQNYGKFRKSVRKPLNARQTTNTKNRINNTMTIGHHNERHSAKTD